MLNDTNTYNWLAFNANNFNRNIPKTSLGPTKLSGASMNLIAPKSASVTYRANQGLNMGLDFMAPKEINKSFGIKPGQWLRSGSQKLGGFARNNPQAVMGIGQGMGVLSSIIPSYTQDPTTQLINQGMGAVGDLAMAVPGGQAVGLAIKGAGLIGKGVNALTGGALTMDDSTSGIDKVLSSDYLNWTPVGLVNKLTGSKVAGTDEEITNLAQDYGNAEDIDDYERGGIAKGFDKIRNLFRKKKNRVNKVKEQKYKVESAQSRNMSKGWVSQTSREDQLAAMNSTGNTMSRNQIQLGGGLRQEDMRLLAAKKGTKLSLKNIKRKVATKFQQGGKVNLIVDGSLHARKNNMELGDITHKGVPVVSYEEGGEITQHAEVEREELILHKELTDNLEKLLKKYKDGDEQAIIEAGKLLAFEILENTKDNTGTLEAVNYG
jgi:hypothetical protein